MENLNDHVFSERESFAVCQVVGRSGIAAVINHRFVRSGYRNAGIGMGNIIRVRRAGTGGDRHGVLLIIDNDLAKIFIALPSEIEGNAFARQFARFAIILRQDVGILFKQPAALGLFNMGSISQRSFLHTLSSCANSEGCLRIA